MIADLDDWRKSPHNTFKKEGTVMADKPKEKETKGITPWRPFMDLARWERDMMEDFFGRRTRPWWPERWFGSEELEVVAPTIDLL